MTDQKWYEELQAMYERWLEEKKQRVKGRYGVKTYRQKRTESGEIVLEEE